MAVMGVVEMMQETDLVRAQRLARRANRLVKLVEMEAPSIIIENEVRMIREALALMRGKPQHALWMMKLKNWWWNWQCDRDRRHDESDGMTALRKVMKEIEADGG